MFRPFDELLPIVSLFLRGLCALGADTGKGCLLVFNAQEAIHLFVENGMIVHAVAGKIEGAAALDRAFQLKGSSYGWISGAEPAKKDLEVDMQEYLHKNSIGVDQRFGKTIRMSMPTERKEKKLESHYYFI